MKTRIVRVLAGTLIGLAVWGVNASTHENHEPPEGEAKTAKVELKLENLLKQELAGVDGTEVIVSRVTMPPHTTLPKHWHPGEEFGYVLEGTVTLWQDGKPDVTMKAGDVLAVPLKQVHTAITGDEAATILVFRVHEQGQPERVPVD